MYKLSRRAEKILELAREAGREYGLGYVGTEHLLLGILREGTGAWGPKSCGNTGSTRNASRPE